MARKTKKARGSAKRDAELKKALRRFIRARGTDFLADPNVTSVGIGLKEASDPEAPHAGELSLVFTVGEKVGLEQLESLGTEEIPPTIEVEGFEVPTDVLARSYRRSYTVIKPEETDPRKVRFDPIQPGISVSHVDGSAGTIGAIVYDDETGAPCILSNWHVLHGNTGEVGDPIVQPGPHDDNNIGDNLCGELLRSHLGAAGDCAIARIRDRSFDPKIFSLHVTPRQIAEVDLHDHVVKSGRTTGDTYGIVRRIDVMVKIDFDFPAGVVAVGGFEIGIDPDRLPRNGEVSMRGDSGSAWLIADGDQATDIFAGLHFAGETARSPDEHAIACYPLSVQKKLRFSLSPPEQLRVDDDEVQPETFRQGFDDQFLGILAPMPRMSRSIKIDAVNFGRRQTIPYTHFSVCLSARRRLARFVAWNVDGARRVVAGGKSFRRDPRIDDKYQWDNDLYENNNLDRGHIARRADLTWGPVEEARQANSDSFLYTNIAPQHELFNRSSRGGLWGKLENLILEQADAQDIRVSVIAGPLFKDDDQEYRGAKIPRDYWKLIAYRNSRDELASSAYVLSQSNFLRDVERVDLDPFRLFQVSLEHLSEITELGFDDYIGTEVSTNPERAYREPFQQLEGYNQDTDRREIFDENDLAF
ncbi:MAG: DNA/RNA non-specific endonuclease [Pseudomonadota bacterium]